MTADLCACRTAPSARRRGRRTSCAPTATAGCAARAPRSTGTALPPGARSFPAPTRDRQVALAAVLPGSRAPKQRRAADFRRAARSHLVSLLGVRVGVASEPFSGDRFTLGSPFGGGGTGRSECERDMQGEVVMNYRGSQLSSLLSRPFRAIIPHFYLVTCLITQPGSGLIHLSTQCHLFSMTASLTVFAQGP